MYITRESYVINLPVVLLDAFPVETAGVDVLDPFRLVRVPASYEYNVNIVE